MSDTSGEPVLHEALHPMLVDIDSLRPHPENPNRGDIDAIVESITENGYYAPVIAQRSTGHILAGSHRWRALRQLGHTRVPAVVLDVDDDRARRIMLADNRTTRLGHDDTAALVALLEDLATVDAGLAGTGYTNDDLDALLSIASALDVDEGDDEDVNAAMAKAAWPAVKLPPVLLARLRELDGPEDADRVCTLLDHWEECLSR